MILNSKPLAIVEAAEYVKTDGEKKPIHEYIKSFGKATAAQAKKIRESLSSMNNPKFKEAHIVKVIDLLPQDAEDVHKIFNDVSLSEEEVNAVLSVLQK